jgi:hypothetical protein
MTFLGFGLGLMFRGTAALPTPGPAAPDAPAAIVTTPANGQITYSWVAPDDNGDPITGYKVESYDGVSWSTLVADTGSTDPEYVRTGLTNGLPTTLRFRAINGIGEGDPSSSVTEFAGVYDLYVMAAGSDSNDGTSRATALLTLAALRDALDDIDPDGVTVTAYVEGGRTWSDPMTPGGTTGRGDVFSVALTPAAATVVDVTFGPDTLFDGLRTERLADPGTYGAFDGEVSAISAYGDANFTLKVRSVDNDHKIIATKFGGDGGAGNIANSIDGSAQCFSIGGGARLEVYGAEGYESGEIVSAHETATGFFKYCLLKNGLKTVIANVATSSCEFEDTEIEQDQGAAVTGFTGATYGPICNSDYGDYYLRVTFRTGAAATGPAILQTTTNDRFEDSLIGTLTSAVRISPQRSGAAFDVCYLNCDQSANWAITYNECYGRFAVRWINTAGEAPGTEMTNGVIVGTPTAAIVSSGGVPYTNTTSSATGPGFTVTDTVLAGFNTAIGNNFSSTSATNFIGSPVAMTGNCLHGNTTNVDADVATANAGVADPKPIRSNYGTGMDLAAVDPQLAGLTANGGSFATLALLRSGSTDRADYCVTNATLATGGVSGGQVGFAA